MTQRDKDGDGFLDHNEILQWILPEDFDHIHAEVEHLLREADANQVCIGSSIGTFVCLGLYTAWPWIWDRFLSPISNVIFK